MELKTLKGNLNSEVGLEFGGEMFLLTFFEGRLRNEAKV